MYGCMYTCVDIYVYMYLSVGIMAQASQMAHTSGSVDQHADLVPGEDPRLCDLHLSWLT